MKKLLVIITTLFVLKHTSAQIDSSLKEQYDNQMRFTTTVKLNTVKNTENEYNTPQDTTSIKPKIAKNTFYVEALGNGIIGSINYDRLFFIEQHKFSFRIGGSYYPITKENDKVVAAYSIPIELNYLKGNKHNIEFGIGLTYAYGFNSSSGRKEVSEAIYSNFKLVGYRFQKPSGGIFTKINFLLIYKAVELNENWIPRKNEFIFGPYFGLSMGYTF